VVIGRVDPRDRRPALALLLTGRADAAEPVVETFFGFAAEQNLGLDNLWAARRGGQVLVSALVAPCAGRTGLIYLSPNVTAALVPIAAALVTAACRGQDSRQVRMVQALLDPGQEPMGLALDAAGFQRLAVLIYMQRGVQPHPVPLELEPGIEAQTWVPGARPAFARAILASYEQTLDCPGLLGLRDIGDIVDGHMATGKFVPELWLRLESRGAPVGVMLLNVVPQRAALELVYLGLSPAWRGRGLARRLLLHGLGLAPRYGANQMILAVDDHNAPALRMYTALRFAPVARKAALILPLGAKTP
jgi:ribosomal protein S18 acetylase RimI-like enzyme